MPESTINLTPSIVMEVSAILVDIMHLRTPSGGTSNTCGMTEDEGSRSCDVEVFTLPDPVPRWTGHCVEVG